MRDDALPLVSVVVPCFNQAAFLRESIASALASYSGPIEVVVVDDGSTMPGSNRLFQDAERMSADVRTVRKENGGLSSARNAGIAACRGQYVQLLDADDLIAPPKIDAQVAHFALRPSLDVSVGDFLLCDEDLNSFWKPGDTIGQFSLSKEDFLYRWERGMAIPIHCALFKRSVLGESPFPEALHAKEDWVFWTKLCLSEARMAYIPLHLSAYRQHSSSMRRSVLKMAKSWVRAIIEIDEIAAERHSIFFDRSIDWLNTYYRQQIEYREEMEGTALPDKASDEVQLDVSRSLIEQLIVAASSYRPGEKPLISIVIPIYNHFQYLPECLLSALNQISTDSEIVCVDDGSSDRRVRDLLETLKSACPGLKILSMPENSGISATQNYGVAATSGKYIAFLDCDDSLQPSAIAEVEKLLLEDESIGYLFTDRFDVNSAGDVVRTAIYGGYESIGPSGIVEDDLLDGMVASHLKVVRRDLYLEVGGSDSSVDGVQDWDLALKLVNKAKFKYLALPLYLHRIHSRSVTTSARVAQFRKTNVVRRRFLERHFGSRAPVESCEKTLPGEVAGDLRKLTHQLQRHWRDQKRCIAHLSGPIPIYVLNFFREFNSYFDEIYFDEPATFFSLIGYCWSEKMLRPISLGEPTSI